MNQVVGWTDSDGFLYKNGIFETITFPGAQKTEAWGINDSGVIVGWYAIGNSVLGFTLANGQYTSIAFPGAVYTLPFGINASGDIVGTYTIDYTTYHGFVASPALGLQ